MNSRVSSRRLSIFCVVVLSAVSLVTIPASADDRPGDDRLQQQKTLNDYFPLDVPESPEAWTERAERVRRRILVATGLWPMPEKTPADGVVHGPVDRGDYIVEKVFLQSYPGHFVTGNLYRPKEASGPRPGVLCPHGHWPDGRFYDAGEKKLQWQIFRGAERFDPSGRYPTQARCVQLARMGCVVFHYDMIGYADSQQLDHRAGVRPKMNTAENWGYFSPQAVLRLQTTMGLQTYNSVRALDWLIARDDVDPRRIAITGASGGGTQTMILSAIDPRPAVSFPAVMVSTAMQGGCTCENAPYLRIGTGNVEFAALFAPKPVAMTGADDWTREIATKGLPELKRLFTMLGVADHVMAAPLTQFPHNYNYVSRGVMYHWLNKHLGLGFSEPIVAADFEPLSIDEMSVWDDAHPRPPRGDDYERSLLRYQTEQSEKQMAALVPKDAAGLAEYRRVIGGAWDVIIDRALPPAAAVAFTPLPLEPTQADSCRLSPGVIEYAAKGDRVPALIVAPPEGPVVGQRVVLWLDPMGKASMLDEGGQPVAAVRRLLEAGATVVGIDVLGTGSLTKDGQPLDSAPMVDNGDAPWQQSAVYTFGYNHPLFSRRVHDILSAIAAFGGAERLDLIANAGAGHWAAGALAQAGDSVDRASIDTAGFRFAKLDRLDHPDFVPGAAKYLDLPGLIALAAPTKLIISSEGNQPPEPVLATYEAAGAGERLTAGSGDAVEAILR